MVGVLGGEGHGWVGMGGWEGACRQPAERSGVAKLEWINAQQDLGFVAVFRLPDVGEKRHLCA